MALVGARDREFFRIWATGFAIIGIFLISLGIYRIAAGRTLSPREYVPDVPLREQLSDLVY
jgi:hypothetical protein